MIKGAQVLFPDTVFFKEGVQSKIDFCAGTDKDICIVRSEFKVKPVL